MRPKIWQIICLQAWFATAAIMDGPLVRVVVLIHASFYLWLFYHTARFAEDLYKQMRQTQVRHKLIGSLLPVDPKRILEAMKN